MRNDHHFDKNVLTGHVFDDDHKKDWTKYEILEWEFDSWKRSFLELFHKNLTGSSMNEKTTDLFPCIYKTLNNEKKRFLILIYFTLIFRLLSLFSA